MSEEFESIVKDTAKGREQTLALAEKLFAVAQPGSVYSQPVQSGSYTLITASELMAWFGFGSGVAGGAPASAEGSASGESRARQASGAGGGSGGGGGSSGRPVAVITIGPEGVQIKPVVDVTKLGIAALTAIGAMALAGRRMRRFGRH
jgi:uncharacterized spore protein YtfJ